MAANALIIAVKIENHEVRVMAIDGQPAEPFLARGGALVLAPGTRVDAFVDATAAPGTISSILLHDGKEARPIARLVTSGEPPVRAAPLPAARRRCPPTACQPSSISRARCGSIWRSADRQPIG